MNTKKFLKDNTKLTGKSFKLRYLTLIITLIGLSLDTLSAFSIPLSVDYFRKGDQRLAIFFLIFTVCSQIIYAIYRIFEDHFELKYNMYVDELTNKRTVDILGMVKNKIYVTQSRVRRRLSSVEIQENTKNYITKTVKFTDNIMKSTIEFVTFIIMFIGTVKITLDSVNDMPSLIIILLICIIAIIFITIKQIKRRREFSKVRRQIRDEINTQKMDLLNVIPINQKHQDFLTSGYIESSKEVLQKEIKVYLKESFESCYKTGAMALSTVTLLLIAIFSYDSLNMEIFASLMALSTLYNRLLTTLSHEISSIQRLIDELGDKKSYDEIMETIAGKYLELTHEKGSKKSRIESIILNNLDFIHEDTEKKVVHRIVADSIELNIGEVTFINGPSGSGKSTLLKLYTGDYSYNENSILINKMFYRTTIYNYLVYDPESQIGGKSILEEITFAKDKFNVDKNRLIEILKGLNMYDVIFVKAKNEPILDYLSYTFKDTFSAGQVQRLVLARLLYNLDSSVEVVLLDEPVANLDDKTASNVIEFISKFCNEDSERIVIISSHQVNIVKKYSNKNYTFENINESFFKIVLE